ncbi:MAG: hypothetical protein ACPGUD_01980 [Parashewanella sp.]
MAEAYSYHQDDFEVVNLIGAEGRVFETGWNKVCHFFAESNIRAKHLFHLLTKSRDNPCLMVNAFFELKGLCDPKFINYFYVNPDCKYNEIQLLLTESRDRERLVFNLVSFRFKCLEQKSLMLVGAVSILYLENSYQEVLQAVHNDIEVRNRCESILLTKYGGKQLYDYKSKSDTCSLIDVLKNSQLTEYQIQILGIILCQSMPVFILPSCDLNIRCAHTVHNESYNITLYDGLIKVEYCYSHQIEPSFYKRYLQNRDHGYSRCKAKVVFMISGNNLVCAECTWSGDRLEPTSKTPLASMKLGALRA